MDDAKKVLAVITLNIQADRPGLERIRPKKVGELPTFGSLADEWLDDRRAKGRRSVDDDRRRWNRHLAPLLAHRPPDDNRPSARAISMARLSTPALSKIADR